MRKFHWQDAVGSGSYSTVHLVQDKVTGRPMAIKCIRKELLNADVRRQIEMEAALMLECAGHENIVECLEFKNFGCVQRHGAFAGLGPSTGDVGCDSHRVVVRTVPSTTL